MLLLKELALDRFYHYYIIIFIVSLLYNKFILYIRKKKGGCVIHITYGSLARKLIKLYSTIWIPIFNMFTILVGLMTLPDFHWTWLRHGLSLSELDFVLLFVVFFNKEQRKIRVLGISTYELLLVVTQEERRTRGRPSHQLQNLSTSRPSAFDFC